MSDWIEISFPAGLGVQHRTAGDGRSDHEASNDQDTAGLNVCAETRERQMARLENIRIGQGTVSEAVRGLEAVLGYELYPSNIYPIRQGPMSITKVVLEACSQLHKPEVEKLDTIYDITDGGEVDSDMVRANLREVPHRLEDHLFVKFKTRFTKPPSVMLGLNYLHTARSTHVRIVGTARTVYEDLFEVHSSTYADTILYGAGFTWFAFPNYEHSNLLLQMGSFNTTQDHPWNVKQSLTQARITFQSPYTLPPKVVVWLTQIDSDKTYNERVTAFATDITPEGFNLHIDTWGDSFLYAAAISWFAYPVDTPGICSGVLQPIKGTAGVVRFDKPFARPPRRVLVALNKLETDSAFDCRFKIFHEAVTGRGMAVRVETWGNSKIHAVGVAYIAME